MVTDINGAAAEQTARVIQQRGQAAKALAQDVADPDAWAAVFTETKKAFGPVNVLVNNAGVSGAGRDRFEEPEGLDAWRQIMSINLDAVNLGCRMAIQEMKVMAVSYTHLTLPTSDLV